MNLFLETIAQYRRSRELLPGEHETWVAHPALHYHLRRSRPCRIADRLVETAEYEALGWRVLEIVGRIARDVDEIYLDLGLRVGRAHLGGFFRRAFPLAYRGIVLDRWLELAEAEGSEPCVLANAGDRERPLLHQGLYGQIAARSGRVRVLEVSVPPGDEPIAPPAFRRYEALSNLLHRIASGEWLYPVLTRLPRALRLRRSRDVPDVLVFETLATYAPLIGSLLRGGHRVALVRPTREAGEPVDCRRVGSLVRAAFDDVLGRTAFSPATAELVAETLESTVADTLARWPNRRQAIQGILRERRSSFVLCNSFFKPVDQLTGQFLRQRGIPVVGAQHGVGFGVFNLYHPLKAIGDPYRCDAYLCYAPRSKTYFLGEEPVPDVRPRPRIEVVGAPPDRRRVPGQAILRRSLDRMLGLPPHRSKVLIAPNALLGNFHMGPYAERDFEGCALLEAILERAGRHRHHHFILKLYPDIVQPDPHPFSGYSSPNVTTITLPDLRHVRYAADFFVTDSPGSGLEWALGLDRPLLFIERETTRVLEPVREAMAESIFHVDARGSDALDRIDEYLGMTIDELRTAWRARAEPRRRFLAQYLLGPRLSPRRMLARLFRALDQSGANRS